MKCSKCHEELPAQAARDRKRRWRLANYDPVKMKARLAVRAAILQGKLSRPDTCEKCGSGAKRQDGVSAIQGHHHAGYDFPLTVTWLCPPCHRKEHYAAKESGVSP